MISGLGYTPYSAANPLGFIGSAQLGTLARQNATSVTISGGVVSGADRFGRGDGAYRRSRAHECACALSDELNLLDFGGDPGGVNDNTAAFAAAMAAVPSGGTACIRLPRGILRAELGRQSAPRPHDQCAVRGWRYAEWKRLPRVSHAMESKQGSFNVRQVGSGFGSFAPTPANPTNYAFDQHIIESGSYNSASVRTAWARNYTNINRYAKYSGGIDFAEMNVYVWPRLLDNSSGWGHWEIIESATYDEDTAGRGLSWVRRRSTRNTTSSTMVRIIGWTYNSAIGTPVQGMSIDPWGQNGPYGGHILYAYGSVGSYDGLGGGINNRWVSYPAIFGASNPAAVSARAQL